MKNIGNGKICKHIKGHTMGAMDVDKATPAYGTKLRNAWDRARARYISATKKHAAAAKKYRSAKANYDRAMASSKAALNIEASNAHRACKNAHTEYNALVKDVQSNVNSRKQVWISSLVVMCYIDNLPSNAGAKRCADKKRRPSTARWNIHTPRLAACKNKATLIKNFGPANWLPSSRTCHMKHWNEAKFKEQGVKERKAKERSTKSSATRSPPPRSAASRSAPTRSVTPRPRRSVMPSTVRSRLPNVRSVSPKRGPTRSVLLRMSSVAPRPASVPGRRPVSAQASAVGSSTVALPVATSAPGATTGCGPMCAVLPVVATVSKRLHLPDSEEEHHVITEINPSNLK